MDPHYSKQTITSRLHQFTNRQQDLVKQAFRPGNYTYLSKFPAQIKPSAVSKILKLSSTQIVKNKLGAIPRTSPQPHLWMPDNYNNLESSIREDRQSSRQKQRLISPVIFKVPARVYKTKYEQGFKEDKTGFVTVGDPFDGAQQQIQRLKWIKDLHQIGGTFKPGLKDNMGGFKSKIKELMKYLKEKIAQDWGESDFSLGLNVRDQVEIRFMIQTVENLEGLHSYMNTMAKNDAEILSYKMRKMVQYWGITEGDEVRYVFSPPWVKHKVAQAYEDMSTNRSLLSSFRKTKRPEFPSRVSSPSFNRSQ